MSSGASADVACVERVRLPRNPRVPVIAWPGLAHLLRTFGYSVRTSALFAVVFGGADAVARLHTHRVDLSISADRAIPFVPETTLIYSSLYAMFWLVPFVLRTEREIRALARIIAWEIVIATPFFLALPMAESEVPDDLGRFAAAFRFADWINLDHNQFPSLHATFALTVAAVLARHCTWSGRVLLAVWSLGIVAATLLTWQHVLVDVAGAFVLAALVLWRVGWPNARDFING